MIVIKMEEYKNTASSSFSHVLGKYETCHSVEVWKELIFSIVTCFRSLPENTPENQSLIQEKIKMCVDSMDTFLSWIDGEKPDPEILVNSPFFPVCRDAFISLTDNDLSVKSLECIYKSIKVFPVLLPHLIESNLFQAFANTLPFRDRISFPNNKFIAEKSLHLIAEGCKSSLPFTEIAISVGLFDIIYEIIESEITSFDPKTPYTMTLIGIVKNGFKFFVNIFCRPDIDESIAPDDIVALLVECLRNGTYFDDCVTSDLLKLLLCCDRAHHLFLSLDIFPVLWERVSTKSYKTEKSFANTFKILYFALDNEDFTATVVPLIACSAVIDILGSRIGISAPSDGSCIAPALNLVTKMVMNDFVDVSGLQENLSEIVDLCGAIQDNQQFVDKDAAARFYFTAATKIGAPAFEGTEEIAGLLIESIDTKNSESMEAAMLGLETLSESFHENEEFAMRATSFLEESVEIEQYSERSQFLLDNYFKESD